ncbi:MAG: hypothetical protein EPN36_15455 [Rhodanobacteraceae bacterium]|nr:MAG: hypothetical protein EPN36_15455 [Rhodanobacteraceae bacterium]
MTITDIGILLIVLCILLWAIMAALHRHTVQLDALKKQMEALAQARQARSDADARDDHTPGRHDNIEELAARESGTSTTSHSRRSSGQ